MWVPCFPPVLITSGAYFPSPVVRFHCFQIKCEHEGLGLNLGAKDLMPVFLGLLCANSFFASHTFPRVCQRNKTVLSSI